MKAEYYNTPRYTSLRLGRVLVTWLKSHRRLTVRLCAADNQFPRYTEFRLGRVLVGIPSSGAEIATN